jgi:hypothetical protein
VPNVFLYDLNAPQFNGNPVYASLSQSQVSSANGRSMTPYFSPDGNTLAFESWASDIFLVAQDYNQFGDIFACNLPLANDQRLPVITVEMPLTFSGIVTVGGDITFSWPVNLSVAYQVQYKDDLNDPTWHNFGGATSVIGNVQYAQDVAGASQRFYRVVLIN